jgi:hypothetical protein
MFCGGVFVSKPATKDLFVCSDGIEMDQKELLVIVRAILSNLEGRPIQESYPVLYLEAASIRIRFYRGCLFGVCTYHPMSIPLLASLMDRVIASADHCFRTTPEVDISNIHLRGIFLLAIRALITESPSAPITRDIRQSFNAKLDMTMNAGSFHLIDPIASGDFTTVASSPPPSTDDGSTENSTPVETYASEPSIAGEKAVTQFLSVKIDQEVYFEVRDRSVENVRSSVDLWLSASGDLSVHAEFALVTDAVLANVKRNPNVLGNVRENVYSVIDSQLIGEETKVLVFDLEHTEGEELPFEVHCAFAETGGHAEFKIAIGGSFPMAGILVGIDATGLEDPVCQDEPVVVAGTTACLRAEFVGAGEQATWVMHAAVGDGYEPPKIIRVKCKLRGPAFGGLVVKPDPNAGIGIEKVIRDMDVLQSVWPFTP